MAREIGDKHQRVDRQMTTHARFSVIFNIVPEDAQAARGASGGNQASLTAIARGK
jgi:hypothetical protein